MEEKKTFQQVVLELAINMEKNETWTLYQKKKGTWNGLSDWLGNLKM